MSDVRAEPLPEQPSPSPDRTDSATRPDALAGDWAEGLPGPVRAHGLPLPARLGEPRVEAAPAPEAPAGRPETQDPGWSMAAPAPQAATEPAWTPDAHDPGFAPITAVAESVAAPAGEPEAWESPKEASPWAAPAQPAGDWDPTAAAATPA